jgi:hypothetical protein
MEIKHVKDIGITELLEMRLFAGRQLSLAALAILVVQRRTEAVEVNDAFAGKSFIVF